MIASITLFYASLLALLLLGLSARVVMLRRRHQVGLGTGSVGALQRAVRVQANFGEYVPFAILLLALLEWAGAWTWLLHALGAVLVLGRVLHAQGLSKSGGVSSGRFVGTLLTWLVLLVAALSGIGLGIGFGLGGGPGQSLA
ncbi:MAPEG family protein [Halomonas denitrificans]|nr:MAPEG family protein [Halomonas denitrificans]